MIKYLLLTFLFVAPVQARDHVSVSLCHEVYGVLLEAVEHGQMSANDANELYARCISIAP